MPLWHCIELCPAIVSQEAWLPSGDSAHGCFRDGFSLNPGRRWGVFPSGSTSAPRQRASASQDVSKEICGMDFWRGVCFSKEKHLTPAPVDMPGPPVHIKPGFGPQTWRLFFMWICFSSSFLSSSCPVRFWSHCGSHCGRCHHDIHGGSALAENVQQVSRWLGPRGPAHALPLTTCRRCINAMCLLGHFRITHWNCTVRGFSTQRVRSCSVCGFFPSAKSRGLG